MSADSSYWCPWKAVMQSLWVIFFLVPVSVWYFNISGFNGYFPCISLKRGLSSQPMCLSFHYLLWHFSIWCGVPPHCKARTTSSQKYWVHLYHFRTIVKLFRSNMITFMNLPFFCISQKQKRNKQYMVLIFGIFLNKLLIVWHSKNRFLYVC